METRTLVCTSVPAGLQLFWCSLVDTKDLQTSLTCPVMVSMVSSASIGTTSWKVHFGGTRLILCIEQEENRRDCPGRDEHVLMVERSSF